MEAMYHIISTVSQGRCIRNKTLQEGMEIFSCKDNIWIGDFKHVRAAVCGIMTALLVVGCMMARISGSERASDSVIQERK